MSDATIRLRSLLPAAALATLGLLAAQLPSRPARAQEPVVGAADPDALFHSRNPRLNANMQVAYHIEKDLLEAGHWELADRYLSARYLQHNPNVISGLAPVVRYFTQTLKVQPKPIPEKIGIPVVAVLAQGDLVIVVTPRTYKDPRDPARTYTTTWFDMWRIRNGKADEHWDCATRM
ncbi:MAG TPA: nuclear transport factor 2 family protein [Steroidobacteraceae bacterium]|nr:nuclear transport factor 2 family protein [Steroidobacteraceae bacterium]